MKFNIHLDMKDLLTAWTMCLHYCYEQIVLENIIKMKAWQGDSSTIEIPAT